MWRRVVSLAGIIALIAHPSVGATVADVDRLVGDAQARIAPVRDAAERLRAAAAAPSLAERTAGILRAGGHEAPQRPDPPRVVPADPEAAIDDLLAGVHAAERLLGPISAADLQRGMELVGDHMAAVADALRPGRDGPDPDALPPAPELPAALRRTAAQTPAAALLLAAALDRALPVLSAASGAGSDAAVDGCDVRDEPPYVCVGSEADNTYTEQYALMVDLGGNDTHLHPAGGAPFTPDGSDQAIPVAVTVDLAGDDRYVAQPIPGASLYPAGQGFGVLGGVGLLVDRAGNDVYSSTAPGTSAESPDASSLAQGIGLLAGFGALFDEDGDDTYTSEASDGTDDFVFVYGQGVGYLFGGAGAVVDLGGGDDAYRLSAGTVHGLVREWDSFSPRHTRQVQGQGQAYSGIGVLVDDGGTDQVVADAHARSRGEALLLDPDWEPPPLPPVALFPIANIWAQGNGIFGGVGMALTGSGATTFQARGTADQTSQASLLVQGYGFFGAVGVLDDTGGDDSYVSEVTSVGEVGVRSDATCGCGPAELVFEQVVSGTSAQGWAGSAGAAGLLYDHGGDDRYRATNDQVLDTLAEDLRDSDTAAPATIDLTAWPPPTMAQGWATIDAAGTLIDADGTDTYTFRSRLDATATAQAEHAAGSTATVTVMPRLFALGAQGAARKADAAYGTLLDLGGTGDHFEAEAATHAATTPAGGARTVGFLWPPFHGSGDTGVFAALGTDPTIVSRPSQGVCAASTGPRGFGLWSECAAQGPDADRQVFDLPAQRVTQTPDAQHLIVGTAPNAVGAEPGLEVRGPDAFPQDGPIAAEATLTGPDGAPLAGELVRFDLQFALAGGAGGLEPAWSNGWEVTAVTDDDGIARAAVPADLTALHGLMNLGFPGPENWLLRLLASYDGASGLHPRHVAHSFATPSP